MTLHSRERRVAEEIRHALAELILSDIKDPRVSEGLVSVTSVEVSKDLKHARAWISVLGTEEAQKDAIDALQAAAGFIRREIAQRVVLRFVPTISFKLDHSMEHADKINRLLKQAVKDEPPAEAPED